MGNSSTKCCSGDVPCAKHKCLVPLCNNLRKPPMALTSALDNEYFYCEKHNCVLYKCRGPKMEDDNTCKNCKRLPRCAIYGCISRYDSKIPYSNKNGEQWVCPNHYCKTHTSCCMSPQYEGSPFCQKHKCSFAGCQLIATKVNGYCNDHKVNAVTNIFNKHAEHLVD